MFLGVPCRRMTSLQVGDGQELLEVLGGISALDSINRVLWIELVGPQHDARLAKHFFQARNNSGEILIRLYGYDVDTGFLLNVLDDVADLITLDFYPATGARIGTMMRQAGRDANRMQATCTVWVCRL